MLQETYTLSTQLQQHLNDIKAHYQAAKSYLSYASRWYAELSWWNKIQLGGALMIVSTCIGLAMQAGLLFFMGSCLLYASVGFLLLEHHEQGTAQAEAVSQQITALESSLNQSLQLQTELQQVVAAINEKNEQLTQENQRFTQQIETVTQQNITYDDVVVALKKTQQELQLRTQELEKLQTQAMQHQQTNQSAIDKQIPLLQEECLSFGKTNLALSLEEQRLARICLAFENSTARLTQIEQELQHGIQSLPTPQNTDVLSTKNVLSSAEETLSAFEKIQATALKAAQESETLNAQSQQLLLIGATASCSRNLSYDLNNPTSIKIHASQ